MAKPKGRSRNGPEAGKAAPADASDPAIRDILKYYAIGRQARDKFPEGAKQDSGPIKSLSDQAKVGFDIIRKARKFAELYDQQDLDVLCRLRDPGGKPLTWTHVHHLLSIGDKVQCEGLARRAAEEGWSSRTLKSSIEADRGGPRSKGGHPGRTPRTPQVALRELIGLCEKLRHYWENVEGEALRAWAEGPTSEEAVPKVRDLASQAVAKLGEVEALARRAAKQLRNVADAQGERAGEPATTRADPGKAETPP